MDLYKLGALVRFLFTFFTVWTARPTPTKVRILILLRQLLRCYRVLEIYPSVFFTFRILKVLGRTLRDFLSNLDNLHEYLRFSYPKIKPPSFFVTDETPNGLTLHYRSKRKGFVNYVKGQVSDLYSSQLSDHVGSRKAF